MGFVGPSQQTSKVLDTAPTAAPRSARQEILREFRQQALNRSEKGANEIKVKENLNPSTQKGEMSHSLWPHDEKVWNNIPDIKTQPVNLLLPGYAVGDRYSTILTMLLYPKMKLTIAYSESHPLLPREKEYAMEAHKIISESLLASGLSQKEINERLSVVQYDGPGPLDQISGSFNDDENRSKFTPVSGAPSSLCERYSEDKHVFHISASTVMLAQHWEDNNDVAKSSGEIRSAVYKLITPDTKASLDKLVDQTIQKTGLKENSALLWVTNKPFEKPVRNEATARQKEAFANPVEFVAA
jgi:hypothetical protein